MTIYRTLFSDKPGAVTHYEHAIRLVKPNPFIKRSCPVPLSKRVAVEKEWKEMLNNGIREYSRSPFCNPLRVVDEGDLKTLSVAPDRGC